MGKEAQRHADWAAHTQSPPTITQPSLDGGSHPETHPPPNVGGSSVPDQASSILKNKTEKKNEKQKQKKKNPLFHKNYNWTYFKEHTKSSSVFSGSLQGAPEHFQELA